MRKVLFVFFLLVVSCSSNNNENSINNDESPEGTELIVGSWDFVRIGLVYNDGSQEILVSECSNSQKFRFFEGGAFEVEIWWIVDGVCTFDQIRDGNYLKTTNPDYPDANYRLRFFAIPDDDEVISYPEISFEGNNQMRIQYVWENSPVDGVTHRFLEYVRE